MRCYRIQVVPNKSSVYTEYLPTWAQPVPDNPISRMLEQVGSSIYVDSLPSLLDAKTRFSAPLYYRTDSHWNALGAWIAYRDLAQSVESFSPEEIQWLAPDQMRLSVREDQAWRDLAGFLWLGDVLGDTEVMVDVDIGRPIPTVHVDFETGERTSMSDNPRVGAPQRPLLVHSPNALNQARVLWLRDSFGTAMAPFMAATFSETLQLNYGLQSPEEFASMVDQFKPDYVIVTGVERASLSDWFQLSPPD
ncbi:MAG: hypothetical protein MZV65_35105 [Chromatiales bacterium]|nr:hypothetical protein [Chromatiales bacterium]MCK7580362.1 hypothetical protein [Chromatiales bacterium]